MKAKITFTALAIATLVAAPAFAQQAPKQRAPSAPPATVNQNNVVVDGKIIGADPDPRIRMELLREHLLDPLGW
jgi:hypothetical protein